MFRFYIIFQSDWILLRRYERFLIGRISTKKKRKRKNSSRNSDDSDRLADRSSQNRLSEDTSYVYHSWGFPRNETKREIRFPITFVSPVCQRLSTEDQFFSPVQTFLVRNFLRNFLKSDSFYDFSSSSSFSSSYAINCRV